MREPRLVVEVRAWVIVRELVSPVFNEHILVLGARDW